MADSVFRSAPEIAEPTIKLPDPKMNEVGANDDGGLQEPLDSSEADEVVLNAIGVDDLVANLDEDSKSNLSEVSQYVLDILKGKGVTPTQGSIERTLNNLKAEMGLDSQAAPSMVLDRIGGVVKAWKGLSFITNPQEKRSLFMKLANMKSSSEMNKAVFDEMNRRSVWE